MAAENRTVIEVEIMKACSKLDKADKMVVLRYLKNKHVKVVEGGDGTRVNLSGLSRAQLEELNTLAKALMSIQMMLTNTINNETKQGPYKNPTVFNFYLPDYYDGLINTQTPSRRLPYAEFYTP